MYSISIETILLASLLLVIFTWIGSVKASRLLYSRTIERMHRKTRKLLFWSWFPVIPAAAILGAIAWMQQTMSPAFWIDHVLIQAPLVLLPLLIIWLVSVPKLFKLRALTKPMPEESDAVIPTDASVHQRAASPGLILPFQMMALAALTSFYFALVPALPFKWLDISVPLAVFVLATAGLWLRHRIRFQQVSKMETYAAPAFWKRSLAMLTVFAVLGASGYYLFTYAMDKSELPAEIDMASGTHDYGGTLIDMSLHNHSAMAEAASSPSQIISVADLTGLRKGTPDRRFTLTAQKKTVTLSSGKTVDAWTYNGQIPGPELRMKEGELIEVTLLNQDIEQGVTADWHGLDVPNAEDGVAGATQHAVMPGESYTYRFRAEQAGTFWYHSHQDSREAVSMGLFGVLIVEPKTEPLQPVKDITVMTHRWQGAAIAIGASDQLECMTIAPGTPVRMRLINTDDWVNQTYTLVGTHFEVAAIDGRDLNKPDVLTNTRVVVPTGGRYDITFVMPERPVYLHIGENGNGGILMSSDGSGDLPEIGQTVPFNPLTYGSPAATAFNAHSRFDREFTLILDNKLGIFNRNFGFLYTLNGEVFPDTPMFMMKEGDLVKTTILNRGDVAYPMHLQGHHVLVLSRNGKPSTGSPWWSDTLDVQPGETYEVAFVADNPGLWIDPVKRGRACRVCVTLYNILLTNERNPFTL
ncbi:multicopper oxidase family protein [Paenibacillus planticolens]|uniref:Multicopper oxidase domain-containing protein n=1 Tax=Paenibacillus planticolens TaxID=2654976 RepID=A0ABX1ZUY9_9BACL|nr:multicopper oxidase family protein [Paenibacillus planticolens]NOV02613.1 multicopper oxidase domain-containing protein [Paenibacillus planticolens]